MRVLQDGFRYTSPSVVSWPHPEWKDLRISGKFLVASQSPLDLLWKDVTSSSLKSVQEATRRRLRKNPRTYSWERSPVVPDSQVLVYGIFMIGPTYQLAVHWCAAKHMTNSRQGGPEMDVMRIVGLFPIPIEQETIDLATRLVHDWEFRRREQKLQGDQKTLFENFKEKKDSQGMQRILGEPLKNIQRFTREQDLNRSLEDRLQELVRIFGATT